MKIGQVPVAVQRGVEDYGATTTATAGKGMLRIKRSVTTTYRRQWWRRIIDGGVIFDSGRGQAGGSAVNAGSGSGSVEEGGREQVALQALLKTCKGADQR